MEVSPRVAALIGILVAWLVTSAFIHFGAGFVTKRRRFGQAMATAFIGSLLAGLVLIGAGGLGMVGVLLALAAWALVAGAIYRTTWIGGVAIGIMAWLLWWLVNFLLTALLVAQA